MEKLQTMYAEFVACYEATGQVNWLKKFIPGLKVIDNINEPLRLYSTQRYSMLTTIGQVVLPNTLT